MAHIIFDVLISLSLFFFIIDFTLSIIVLVF